MRTHVTFQSDFSKESDPGEPAGRDLAQAVASALDAAGCPASPPQSHEGYAYAFTCRRDKESFTVIVALVDDGALEWLIFVEPQTGTVTRLLQKAGLNRSKPSETPRLQEVCSALHQYLRTTPRFQSIRWYSAEGWDENPDADWARSP